MRLSIPSNLAAGRDVQDRILDDLNRLGYHQESLFAIELAIEEALTNAIRHGNQLDERKKVHIEARLTPREAEIIIEDEGPGFERCNVPDPTLPENLEKCCGRGILLIESYMNRVEWTRGGRRVRMIKKNEPKALVRELED